MPNKEKKKLIIIGGGISGLTAGIYALDNNFDVTIYEKHSIVGGQCTGWDRKGTYIDGCAHWIVGTNPQSDFYPVWKYVGGINENTKIYETEYFSKYDINGNIVTLYSDLGLLKEELLRVAPEDKKKINRFINGIKIYRFARVPIKKPLDHLNLFQLTKFGLQMLPMLFHYIYYKHTSVGEYAKKFKSPILQELLTRFMDEHYNVHSAFYILKSLYLKDAGMVEGGSRKLAFNIEDTFLKKGGKIIKNCEIDHILIKDNTACGIVTKKNEVIESDYVISCCDAYHTMNTLLKNQYEDSYYETRFTNSKDYPINTGFQFSYRVNKVLNNYPKMMNFKIDPIKIGNQAIEDITIRNHSFDPSLNKNDSTLTILISSNESVYNYLSSLTKKEYKAYKNELGERIRKELISYIPLTNEEIELLDVTTPLTYERYTNAYKGSYMSFITTKKSKGLMRKGLIKKLKNFAMGGQWIMPPGGLPIALFSGKYATIRICKMAKIKFTNPE